MQVYREFNYRTQDVSYYNEKSIFSVRALRGFKFWHHTWCGVKIAFQCINCTWVILQREVQTFEWSNKKKQNPFLSAEETLTNVSRLQNHRLWKWASQTTFGGCVGCIMGTFFQQCVRKCVPGHFEGPPTLCVSGSTYMCQMPKQQEEATTTSKMDSCRWRTHEACCLIFICAKEFWFCPRTDVFTNFFF